jgi:SAM-dependent methyltransferase
MHRLTHSTGRFLRKLKWRLLYPQLRTENDTAAQRHAKVGPPRLWKINRDFQFQFLIRMGLEPQDYLLDLGCGTLRGGIPIIDYLETSHYVGIDVRQDVLDEARKELEESQLVEKQPTLILVTDISSLNLKQKFDYIWGYVVLIHMEDKILYDSLRFVRHHVQEDACFYASVNVANRPDGSWQGFPVVFRSLGFYEEACARYGLQMKDLGPLEDLGYRDPRKTAPERAMHRMLKITPAETLQSL